jgi:hypothetical protein
MGYSGRDVNQLTVRGGSWKLDKYAEHTLGKKEFVAALDDLTRAMREAAKDVVSEIKRKVGKNGSLPKDTEEDAIHQALMDNFDDVAKKYAEVGADKPAVRDAAFKAVSSFIARNGALGVPESVEMRDLLRRLEEQGK